MDIRAVLMGLSFALIWSSAFTSARIIVQVAPPFSVSALRFLIAGGLSILIAYLLGQRARFSPAQWRAILIFGICQNAIYLGLNFYAMQTIEASLASIIASTMPLLVALFSVLFFRDHLPLIGTLGLVAGFAGVIVIMAHRFGGTIDTTAVLLCVVAAIALAIATLTIRSATSADNLLMVVGMQMLVGAATLSVPALLFETWDVTWTPVAILALAYTIVIPGIVATYIWFKLVERIGATKAATFHFLNPFFGVAIAAMFLSETLSKWDVIGVVIVMVGIYTVQRSKLRA